MIQRLYDYVASRLMVDGVLVIGPGKFFLPGVWEVDTHSVDFVLVEHPDTPAPTPLPWPEGFRPGAIPPYVAPPQLYIEPKPLQRFEFPRLDTPHGRRMVRKALWYRMRCWWKGSSTLGRAPWPRAVPDPAFEPRFSSKWTRPQWERWRKRKK